MHIFTVMRFANSRPPNFILRAHINAILLCSGPPPRLGRIIDCELQLDAARTAGDYRSMKTILIIFASLLAACQAPVTSAPLASASAAPAAPSPAKPSAADLLVQLRAMTADNSCAAQAQCRTVAVGARPCGGPEGFIAYSVAGADISEAVQAKAAQLTRARTAELARRGDAASICTVVTDPGAICAAASCQLGKGSGDPR